MRVRVLCCVKEVIEDCVIFDVPGVIDDVTFLLDDFNDHPELKRCLEEDYIFHAYADIENNTVREWLDWEWDGKTKAQQQADIEAFIGTIPYADLPKGRF